MITVAPQLLQLLWVDGNGLFNQNGNVVPSPPQQGIGVKVIGRGNHQQVDGVDMLQQLFFGHQQRRCWLVSVPAKLAQDLASFFDGGPVRVTEKVDLQLWISRDVRTMFLAHHAASENGAADRVVFQRRQDEFLAVTVLRVNEGSLQIGGHDADEGLPSLVLPNNG